jgi:hypothetical protein
VRVVRHRPAFIVSEKVRGVIRDALGPYRASGGWWEDRWMTEEWDIETDDGLFRLRRNEREWLVEGSYDETSTASGPRTVVSFNTEPGK